MQIKVLMHDKNKYRNHILETEEGPEAQSSFVFFIHRISEGGELLTAYYSTDSQQKLCRKCKETRDTIS